MIKLLNKVKIMEENDVWFLIEKMNWDEDNDEERCNKILLEILKEKDWNIEDYSKLLDTIHTVLYEKLEAHNFSIDPDGGYGLGDDSFSYLCSSILGKGKDVYNKVLNDNNIARKMAEDNDFEEGFWSHLDKSY